MYKKLESVRGVAACMVVLHHTPYVFGENQLSLVTNAYLFVDFFFVLSGFVMAYAYTDKIEGGLPFTSYIALRFGRLYPLHLFTLLALLSYFALKVAVGLGDDIGLARDNANTFLSNIFLVQAMHLHDSLSWNQPSWTISVEFFAYILFFITSVTFDKKGSVLIPLLISVPAYVFLVSLDRQDFRFTFDYGFIRCIASFYLGVAILRLKPKLDSVNWGNSAIELLAVILILVSVALAGETGWAPLFAIAAFAFGVLVFSSASNGLVGRLFLTQPLMKIGLWSYSIYMVHELALRISGNVILRVFKVSPSGPISIAFNIAVIAMVILVSRFTYTYIEKTGRDFVRRRVLR